MFLLPFRAILIVLTLLSAWLIAKLGMVGLSKHEIELNTVSRKGTTLHFDIFLVEIQEGTQNSKKVNIYLETKARYFASLCIKCITKFFF